MGKMASIARSGGGGRSFDRHISGTPSALAKKARSGETSYDRAQMANPHKGDTTAPASLRGAGTGKGVDLSTKMQRTPAANPDAGVLSEGKTKPAIQ